MVKRSVIERLKHMVEAIDQAHEILNGRDFGFYQQSVISRRGVERCIEIVSEASRHVPLEMQDQFPDIPWAAIRGVGNKLRHQYYLVDDYVIWKVTMRDLAPLRHATAQLLSQTAD